MMDQRNFRIKIAEGAENLHDPHKKVLDFLADHSRLFGIEDVNEKGKFTEWVLQIYRELIKNEIASIIMQIVSCASKVVIIYMPEHDNISDIENTGNAEYIYRGLTYARDEQIIIAAKDYENEKNRDQLKGSIIHEFAHFVVYETFCNRYYAVYLDDDVYKTQWIAAMQECKANRHLEKLIDQAYGSYPGNKWLREIVVRYFQYQIQYQNDELKLRQFKENFQKLCEICEDYVLKNFNAEVEKIRAIREINESVTMSADSPYKVKAISCDLDFDPSHNFQIVKSNNTALWANYIFYELKKKNHFKGNNVFSDAKYLSEKKNMEKFKLALQRRAKCIFVIDCDDENFAAIKTELKIEKAKVTSLQNIVVLLGDHQNFEIKTDHEFKLNFIPSHLTNEFINDLKVNFQGREKLLTKLIKVEEFEKLTSLPAEKMHKESISMGNQMKLKVLTEYVGRNFLIKNQTDDKWKEFDDFGKKLSEHKKMLVANEPGAGKSTESIKMYYRLKEKYPNDWIVHINFSRLVQVFEEEKEKFHSYSQPEKFKNVFCRSILSLNEFECDIFELMMKLGRVVLIFDSLDEISPFYFELVSNLIRMIFQTFSEQRIIIFTRPHLVIEMEEFKFTIVKIDEIEENARNELISNILEEKCSRKSEETRNYLKKEVLSFLQKRNFHTPLLIRMITEVVSMQKLKSDEITLYDIYKHFCNNFDQRQEDKNENIKAEKMKLRNIDKYFQKCAIEKLIEFRVSSEFESLNNERIEISREDLISFKDDYFTVKVPDMQRLQTKGITIHSDSNINDFDLIHASFNDFYIADFIISEAKSLVKSFKNSLAEIFSMLHRESRLNNVIEFLKGNNDVAEYLKEFDVIYQMIEDKNTQNGVNIMPIIEFIADRIANNSIMKKICRKNRLYTSMILFTDPMKTLEKLCEFKAPKSFVYENILMNRSHEDKRYYQCPINILDILAQCGNEKSLGYEFYVSKDVFGEHFDKLTLSHFKMGQIASMMDALNGNIYAERLDRSFFLMAKNQNKIVIDTFLNFYEKLLKESYFTDPQFSSFIYILLFNKESDHESLKILIDKLADLNNKSVQKLFLLSLFKFELKDELMMVIRDNIKHYRDITSLKHFEKAIIIFTDLVDSKSEGFCSDVQVLLWFTLISILLDNELFDIFKFALNRLTDKYANENSLLCDILMRKDDDKMNILQHVFCLYTLNTTQKEQITDFTFKYYKDVFVCDASKIRNIILDPEFFIMLLTAQNDNPRIISTILQFLNKAENEANSWLDLMISYSNCIETSLIDSYVFTEISSLLEKTGKLQESTKLIKIILQKCKNLQIYSKVIYELFSNNSLTKDQLEDVSDALFSKDDMIECQINEINEILSYKHPEDHSTIIIAASKCKHEGRIEFLMKMLESHLNSELFKSCLLATDNEGKSALFYLLLNEHQKNYLPTLFDKVDSYYTNDLEKSDQNRDLKYFKFMNGLGCSSGDIFYKILKHGYDISEEKYEILEKLFKVLSRDEQKNLIFKKDIYFRSLFDQVIRQSFEISARLLKLMLETIFENENLYDKGLQKLKRFSGHGGGKLLLSADMFSSAIEHYKLKGSEEVKHLVHIFVKKFETMSYNLSIGNFQYFRQDSVIRHLISEINESYEDVDVKNLIRTFIFMLNFDDCIQLLEISRMTIRNGEQSRKLTLFSLIKSMKLNIEELEIFFERNKNDSYESPFDLYLSENLFRFLHEFLDFIESMCTNKTEFRKLLSSHLSHQSTDYDGNNIGNIFHRILYNYYKYDYSNSTESTMYFDIYETLKNKIGDSKLLNDLHHQTNEYGETPIMLALNYTNIEKCLKFFSENLVETSLRDLLTMKSNLNDFSHFLFIGLFHINETSHNDFASMMKPLSNYFEDSEINEMFANACAKKYPKKQNFIHVVFEFKEECNQKYNSQTVLNESLSLVFDEIKKKFGFDRLNELILEEDEDNKTPLSMMASFANVSIRPYLELIEKHFDEKTIRTLLFKNGEILYSNLQLKCKSEEDSEDVIFTVQFYKKYFFEEFEKMFRKVFVKRDYSGNKLIDYWSLPIVNFNEIISDNIHNPECTKTIFSGMNKKIERIRDLITHVRVIKLAEFCFSRDVVKIIFKIKDSYSLMSKFVKAENDYERCEMIELLKEYYPDRWTRILTVNQAQSLSDNSISCKCIKTYELMQFIDQRLESKHYSYAYEDLLRSLINNLNILERRIEQENNFQGYSIVIIRYEDIDKSDNKYKDDMSLLCFQAVFSIPRENLANTTINGFEIEWQYDDKKEEDKFTNLKCSNENQVFLRHRVGNTL